MDTNRLVRALVVGAVLAVGAILLFLFLYMVVLAGMDSAVRLFGSLCTPPLVILVVIGAYFVFIQGKDE
jgi:heme/copper-type cytochrome/quinol oxidase subunit 4